MPCPSMWPKQFWSDQIDLDFTIMIWPRPKWNAQVQIWFVLVENHNLDLTKTVLVGPKWFWSDQIDLDLTIMIWSRPKWIGQVQIVIFYLNESHHFGRDHFILVVIKSLIKNQFGQIKTILDRPKLFWSHRRTRHEAVLCFIIFTQDLTCDCLLISVFII
jgi:hypothetical protein